MNKKVCSRCKRELPIAIFRADPKCEDGYVAICNECISSRKKEQQEEIAKAKIEYAYLDTKMRECKECGDVKPLSEYAFNIRNEDFHVRVCKVCSAKKKRAYKDDKIIRVEKYCPRCKTIKPITSFDVVADKKDGHHDFCSLCRNEYIKSRILIVRNFEKPKLNTKVCNKCGCEKDSSEFGVNNNLPDGMTRYCLECTRVIRLEYSRKSELNFTPEQKLKKRVKSSIRNAFNVLEVRKTKTKAQLGIDMEFIFEGVGPQPNEDYELDHIIPIVLFDYNIDSHVALSFHPNNLRWIPWQENLQKSDTIIWSLIEGDSVLEDIAKELGISKEDNGKRARDIKRDRGQNVNMEVFEDDLSDFEEEDEE